MIQVISSFIIAVIRSDPVAAYRKGGGGQPQNFPAEGEEYPKTFQPVQPSLSAISPAGQDLAVSSG